MGVDAVATRMSAATPRPRLLLFCCRYSFAAKNVIAATLAWAAEDAGFSFDVYYDAVRGGRHYGGGGAGDDGLSLLTGGLISGGRHFEGLATALHRFDTTVYACGRLAFSGPLAALGDDAGASVRPLGEDLIAIFEEAFSDLRVEWPETAVMIEPDPGPGLESVDAYLWPEIFHHHALGIPAAASDADLDALLDRGVHTVLCAGVTAGRRQELAACGFRVEDLELIEETDDYASLTGRIARRWASSRRGWMLADPVLASYWLPVACRERRSIIHGTPAKRVLDLLAEEIAGSEGPAVLGRQHEDSDFFTLSAMGQSLQVIDPGRPPLPVVLTRPARWPALPDPALSEPTDEDLLRFVSEGRVLLSLLFWTGMIREVENLYALADLVALTGLRAGFVLTAPSFALRPSPLDLVGVPRNQGGLFPDVELLLGSAGTGVAIEAELGAEALDRHLVQAEAALDGLGVPEALRPRGWWATMDAPLRRKPRSRSAPPVEWDPTAPYRVLIRYRHPGHMPGMAQGGGELRDGLRRRLRGTRLRPLFRAYRPYEDFEPGPIDTRVADVVRARGFEYMVTKAGFGPEPRVVHRTDDFVAINHTAGRWDGWTPFETINDASDLRRAEKALLARRQPGWLLGTIDTCLWAFSGELWDRAPRLAAIARLAAAGGDSGRLVNVTPRVLARYARLLTPSAPSASAPHARLAT